MIISTGKPASIGFAIGRPIFYSPNINFKLRNSNESRILIAKSLSAMEAESVDLSRFQGLVLEKGGQASHTTIIARTRGVPAVIGVKLANTNRIKKSTIILDGFSGRVILNPNKYIIDEYNIKISHYQKQQQQFYIEREKPAVTLDGHRIEVGANAGSLSDVEEAFSDGAEGIGVLRTELFFIGRNQLPTEEEQFKIYSSVAQLAKNFPVIIRTLDIGGDKHPKYLQFPIENNPFLGCRGLRYYQRNPKIIETQISAILRAANQGKIKIMLPMVTKIEEIHAFKKILKNVITNLNKRGIEYNENTQIGAMIETPSAAEILTKLSEELDFFSIGTNDLIQYLEAVDRTNEYVADSYDPYHPAVFRVISRIINDAHDQKRWVGLCGEMAADPLATIALLGLGIDELSMAPRYIPMIKHNIRQMRKVVGSSCCEELLQARDSNAVTHLLQTIGNDLFGSF